MPQIRMTESVVEHYEELNAAIPDRRYVFMNHGYFDPREPQHAAVPAEHAAFRYSANLVRRLVRGVALEGRTILDVGCGRGGPCAYLSRAGASRVIGVDLSPRNVEFCRDVHVASNLSFIVGDAEQLPLPDASVDVVINVESSHCYPHPERFLAEVRRVVRADGVFCYTDNFNESMITPARRSEQLREAGFAINESVDITTYVANGIAAASRDLIAFFVTTIDSERRNAARVAQLMSDITIGAFSLLATRRFVYWLWQLRPI